MSSLSDFAPRPWLALLLTLLLTLLLALPLTISLLSRPALAKEGVGDDDDETADGTENEPELEEEESEYEQLYRQSRDRLSQPLNLGVAILALVPLTLAAMAYKRTHNDRFLLLAGAFGLFAAKGLALSREHSLGGVGLGAEDVEFIAVILDFTIILLIGLTMLRK